MERFVFTEYYPLFLQVQGCGEEFVAQWILALRQAGHQQDPARVGPCTLAKTREAVVQTNENLYLEKAQPLCMPCEGHGLKFYQGHH